MFSAVWWICTGRSEESGHSMSIDWWQLTLVRISKSELTLCISNFSYNVKENWRESERVICNPDVCCLTLASLFLGARLESDVMLCTWPTGLSSTGVTKKLRHVIWGLFSSKENRLFWNKYLFPVVDKH